MIGADQPFGNRRATRDDEPHAGQVGRSPSLGAHQLVEDVRVAEADGDAVPFNEPEEPLAARVVGHDDGAADEEHGQHVHARAADPEERGDGDGHVVTPEVGAGEHVDDVPGHVAVGQHHPLGRPGGARRVGHEQQVVEVDVRGGRALRRVADERLVVDRALSRASADHQAVTNRSRRAGRRHGVMFDQHPGLGVLDDQGALVRWEAVIDRGKDGAERAGREERLEERGMVRANPGDPIAPDNSQATEPTRQPADALGQLGVGDRTISADDRHVIRIDPRPPLDPRADADALRCQDAHGDRMPDDRKEVDGAPGRRVDTGTVAAVQPGHGRASPAWPVVASASSPSPGTRSAPPSAAGGGRRTARPHAGALRLSGRHRRSGRDRSRRPGGPARARSSLRVGAVPRARRASRPVPAPPVDDRRGPRAGRGRRRPRRRARDGDGTGACGGGPPQAPAPRRPRSRGSHRPWSGPGRDGAPGARARG